nr:hypothetical protein [Pseudomonadota bacterium]
RENPNPLPPGGGGAAAATSTATSKSSAVADATAVGGPGGGFGLDGAPPGPAGTPATATATATGVSGSFSASASTSTQPGGQLVPAISALTSGMVDGTSQGNAQVNVGGASAAFLTGPQGVALATGAPGSASTAAVLAANANIAAAFGSSPSFFAVGELGAGHSSAGNIAQTTTSEIDETVDLTQLSTLQDLIVGFYNGDAVGSGVTGVTFDLYVDTNHLIHQTFATASAAQAWFTNNAIDLGSLASMGFNALTLRAVLSVTSTSANSSFYGDLIVGDPPAGKSAPPHRFVAAMAGFGAAGAGTAQAALEPWRAVHPMLTAPRAMIA